MDVSLLEIQLTKMPSTDNKNVTKFANWSK